MGTNAFVGKTYKKPPCALHGGFLSCEMEFEKIVRHPKTTDRRKLWRRRGPAPDEKVHLQKPCNFLAAKL